MRIKTLFLLIFLLFKFSSIYSQEIAELNTRAEDDIFFNSSTSIYYAENAIDNNIDNLNIEEYIRSLFILAKAYNRLDDFYNVSDKLSLAFKYLEIKGYSYVKSDFYIFSGRFFYKNENYDLLENLLTNEKIISFLDNRGLIEFNILRNYLNIIENKEVDFNIIDNSIALSRTNNFKDLEGELNILYGDSIVKIDKNRAKSYYRKVIEINETASLAKAYLRLGDLDSNIEYLEQSLLVSESLDDNSLTMEILSHLYDGYKLRGEYKNLVTTTEKMKYFNDKKNTFLLKQYKELYNFSYEKDILKLELEESYSQVSLLKLIIISMGVIILFLIIILSIQSYRLRGVNL